MIKDIKLGWRLIKCEINFNVAVYGIVLLVIVCGIFEWITHRSGISRIFAGFFPMILVYTIHSTSLSTLVQSSACKKRMRTTIPALFGTIAMLIANTYCVIMYRNCHEWMVNTKDPAYVDFFFKSGEYEMDFIFTSIFIVLYVIAAILYAKYFLLGILTCVTFFIGYGIYITQENFQYPMISEGFAIAISYGIILLGGLLAYVFCLATYKKGYSMLAFKSELKG